MSKIVGNKLIKLRGEQERNDVAEALGISVSALQMYENGNRIPRDPIKVKIANYYNVPVQTIFFDHYEHDSCPDSNVEHSM